MARNGALHHQQIPACIDLHDLQVRDFYLMVAHLTAHAQSFEHSRRISAGTDGTWFSQTVVLTVSCLTNAIEMMTFHNALEAFTFADAADIDKLAFHEHIDGERFA